MKAGNEKYPLRNSAYALNVQFCLALQQTGGARVEADIIASSLNLPHGSTLRSSTMKKVEDDVGVLIRNMSKKGMQEALAEEVLEQLKEEGREDEF